MLRERYGIEHIEIRATRRTQVVRHRAGAADMNRRIRRRLRVALGRIVPMVGLILLTAAVWGVTAYVCSRQAMLIPPEAGVQIMRQLPPAVQ